MATNGIYSVNAGASAYGTQRSSKVGTDKLDTSDFLRLMAAQLQNQTIYDHIDSSEFLAQLAQFSTLSMMGELTNAIKANMAISLLGKNVMVPAPDYSGGYRSGTVSGITMEDGVPYVRVNDTYYSITDLLEISA